ncbi:SLAM family member 9-like [Dromiciops gliroides]|uniref:SLAM family member 9-like n=1 Tax=Dromiciops gliroides TaxID=33562 RepID=UPI001CC58CB2|nr:SLAM family member 9-like [Dromiciops gliroides]
MTHLLQWLLIILHLQIGEAVSTGNKVPSSLIGTVGKSCILPLNISSNKNIRNIVWLSRNSLATIDVTEQKTNVIITDTKYDNRLEVLKPDYSLQINNLTMEDEYFYRAQINIKSSSETLIQEYFLHVYEELSKPRITVNLTKSENGTCNFILQCSIGKEEKDVTYDWISLKDEEEVTPHQGPILTVSWRPGESEPKYICRVTNPVSNQSAQPNPFAGLCTGPSSVNYVMLVIGILFPVVLCVAIMFGIIFWNKKGQGFIQFSTNRVQQQEASTEGTTVYAQVSHPYRKKTESPSIPDQKDSVTIYSTIQSPKEQKAATLPETSAYDKLF